MTRPSPSTTHAATSSTAPRYERIGFLLALGSAALFSLKGVVVKLGVGMVGRIKKPA